MGKCFPLLYDPLMSPLEKKKFFWIRQRLLSKAKGHVLEIGAGTGVNFPFYVRGKTNMVTAVDPNPAMLRRSKTKIKEAHVPVKCLLIDGEGLPFPDNHFDTVVATLVLCTVPDPPKTLAEIRRVLRPGGRILLFEHVRLGDPVLGKMQDWLTPLWKKVCDGCHLNRNTPEIVEETGLTIYHKDSFYNGLFLTMEVYDSM